jgi:hypothetical protein
MTRDEVFDLLERYDVARVEIGFEGGGDEGTFEEPRVFWPLRSKEPVELSEPTFIRKAWAKKSEDQLEESDLEQPFYDAFCSFNGPGIQGTLYWEVAERKVYADGMEEQWVDINRRRI